MCQFRIRRSQAWIERKLCIGNFLFIDYVRYVGFSFFWSGSGSFQGSTLILWRDVMVPQRDDLDDRCVLVGREC